jgi:hypothetical protein
MATARIAARIPTARIKRLSIVALRAIWYQGSIRFRFSGKLRRIALHSGAMKPPERDRPWWMLPTARVPPAWWLAMAGVLLWIEYVTGIYNQFPVVYVIPVCLAAWYSGRWPALTLAIVIPIAHVVFTLLGWEPANLLTLISKEGLRGSVIVFLALWVARLSEHERALEREVQTMKGLLPICTFCKSIRNDSGEWEHLERFIARRSEAQFSHGVCPSCQSTHYAQYAGLAKGESTDQLA